MFYFLLKSYEGPTKANYQHACIVFAEGLQKLNITYTANIDYYPDQENKYLFKYTPLNKDVQYIVTAHPEEFKELLPNLASYRLIIFDSKDEWVRPQSTALLHYSYRYFMTTCKIVSEKLRPFCFAASNRMLNTIHEQTQIPWLERLPEIFWSHRVTNHYVRNLVKSTYAKHNIKIHEFLDNFEIPEDSHYWNITGRRHNPEYFEDLQKYRYMDAHGGYLTKDGDLIQWDSWKMWEGLLSGMVVITADLDFYKVQLPFRLVPWTHYVPVRYTHIHDAYVNLARLTDEKKQAIALAGQKIALDYFTAKPMAKYILDNI